MFINLPVEFSTGRKPTTGELSICIQTHTHTQSPVPITIALPYPILQTNRCEWRPYLDVTGALLFPSTLYQLTAHTQVLYLKEKGIVFSFQYFLVLLSF